MSCICRTTSASARPKNSTLVPPTPLLVKGIFDDLAIQIHRPGLDGRFLMVRTDVMFIFFHRRDFSETDTGVCLLCLVSLKSVCQVPLILKQLVSACAALLLELNHMAENRSLQRESQHMQSSKQISIDANPNSL